MFDKMVGTQYQSKKLNVNLRDVCLGDGDPKHG